MNLEPEKQSTRIMPARLHRGHFSFVRIGLEKTGSSCGGASSFFVVGLMLLDFGSGLRSGDGSIVEKQSPVSTPAQQNAAGGVACTDGDD